MAGPREDASEAHPRAAGLLACLALILCRSIRPEHGASRVRRRREPHVPVTAAGPPHGQAASSRGASASQPRMRWQATAASGTSGEVREERGEEAPPHFGQGWRGRRAVPSPLLSPPPLQLAQLLLQVPLLLFPGPPPPAQPPRLLVQPLLPLIQPLHLLLQSLY